MQKLVKYLVHSSCELLSSWIITPKEKLGLTSLPGQSSRNRCLAWPCNMADVLTKLDIMGKDLWTGRNPENKLSMFWGGRNLEHICSFV